MKTGNKKIISLILLVCFVMTNLFVTPVFAGTSETVLEPGEYVVPITKLDLDMANTTYLNEEAMGQPQISEVGILTVSEDNTMSLTYRLYGASIWSAMTFANSSENVQMTTVDNNLNIAHVTVPVSDLDTPIGPITCTNIYDDKTNDGFTYGIKIDTTDKQSVEELKQAILSEYTMEYNISYDVFKDVRRHNYNTLSSAEQNATEYSPNIYAKMFVQEVKIETTNSDFPVKATYTINTSLSGNDVIQEILLLQSCTTIVDDIGKVLGTSKAAAKAGFKNGAYLAGGTFSENAISNNQLEIIYNSLEDLIFGCDIVFNTVGTSNTSKYHYFGRLHPVFDTNMEFVQELEFADEMTNVTVLTDSRYFSETDKMTVTVNSDKVYYPNSELGDAGKPEYKNYYDAFSGMAENGKCIVYTISITDSEGNRKGYNEAQATVTLPIPSDWEVTENDNLKFLVYQNVEGAEKGYQQLLYNAREDKYHYEIDYENQVIRFDPRYAETTGNMDECLMLGSYILFVQEDGINPENLESDGIYSVDVRTAKSNDTSLPSMSNAGIVHKAYLVKQGNSLELYLKFRSMTVSNLTAYIGGLNSIKPIGDNTRFGATYYDYYTIAEDGSGTSNALLDNAIYDANTEYACVEAMKLDLTGSRFDSTANAYRVGIVAPIMAALNNLPADEVGDMGCCLILSAPQKLTGNTDAAAIAQYVPVYEEQPDVLRRAIDAATTLYAEADYTADSYEVLTKALTTAEAVYEAGATGEAIRTQVAAIEEAAAQLVSLGNVVKTDLEAALTEAKGISNDDDTYTEVSFAALEAAIAAAQAVYDDSRAGQSSVDAQVTALKNAIAALVRNAQLANGEYEAGVTLRKAYADEASMGNSSLNQTGILKVNEDGSATLKMNFHSMSFSGFTGYLGYLKILDKDGVGRNKFGGWDYDDADVLNVLETVESYDYMPDDAYTGTNSTDPDIGGKNYQYPKTYVLNIDDVNKRMEDGTRWWEEVYVEVYAPVMASVPGTSGRQEARLLIDFSAYDAAGNNTDTTELEAVMEEAQAIVDAGQGDVSDSTWNALVKALEASGDLLGRNPTATQVNAQKAALQAAIDSVKTAMMVDKTALNIKITAAQSIIDTNKNKDKYTQASFSALNNTLAMAKKVYENADAAQTEVDEYTEALQKAMDALVEAEVSLPATEEGESYPVDAAMKGEAKLLLEVQNNKAYATSSENGETFDLSVTFTSTSITSGSALNYEAATPSHLQFFAYDLKDGNGYQVTTRSAIQFENGKVIVQIPGIADGTVEIPVALGYVQEELSAAAVFSLLESGENPFTSYGDGITTCYETLVLNWQSAYAAAYPEVTGETAEALSKAIAEAEALYEENKAAGASDRELSVFMASINAAKDMQERNEANQATAAQLLKTTASLNSMIAAMTMETTANPIITAKAEAAVDEQVEVIMTAATDATVYYTIDGSEPTTQSAEYDAETGLFVTLEEAGTVTVKAIAVKAQMYPSAVVSHTITFTEQEEQQKPGGADEEKESNFYLPVELQKQYQEDLSMGNVAFSNNPLALAVDNGDGTYDIQVCTNPVNVSGYRSAIIAIETDGYDVDVILKDTVDTTDKFDGTVHKLNYVSKFIIRDVPYGEESILVYFDVPYTPMDEAVDGELTARLCFDWSSAKATSKDSLAPNDAVAKGETEITSEAVDITDKTTGIRLTADEDVLPEGTSMTVSTITSGTDYDNTVAALEGIAEQFKLYNITVKADGADAEPTTTVKIYFPIPDEYDAAKVAVYRINDDGTKVVVKGEVKNGYYIIETKTFGLYALALTDEVLNQEKYEEAIQKVVDQYPDLQGHWAVNSMAAMVNRGLLSGVSATEMAPDTNLTRGMLVTILHRMAGNPAAAGGMQFSDVADTAWYAEAVRWASNNGIASGMGNGKFAPDQSITREQLAAMLVNYANAMNIELPPALGLGFSDADSVSDWADEAVRIMVNAKVIGGYEDGTLRPGATATRAEAASMLERFLTMYVDPMMAAEEETEDNK